MREPNYRRKMRKDDCGETYMSEEEAVLATLEEYAEAYCAKDVGRLMALFDDRDDISLIGTGADELCSGRAQVAAVFERNFADATATRFDWGWKQVTPGEKHAVVAIALTLHLETADGPLQVPLRWTVSLAKTSAGWRWLHRHASTAAISQDDGTAYPAGNAGN